MSSITSGTFPFQNSTQDAYSNYENPAFRIRIRDIRDTGLPAVDGRNDVDYSKQLNVGETVIGKKSNGKTERLYKGPIIKIAADEKGRQATVTIRSENQEIDLDPDSVVKVDDTGDISDMELLGYHDNFYVPGPSKNMSEPQRITAESTNHSRIIKTFSEFKNGL
jgi:hypothetical protein